MNARLTNKCTSALLTLQNATSHLHHFCTLLGFGPYIDNRPQFEFTKTNSGVKAQVILPISMDPSIRIANSSRSWATERLAQQDAAFEAYKNLYLAGLVNDNLLPTRQEAAEAAELQIPDRTPALVQVSPILDPWPLNAQALQRNPHAYYRTLLTLRVPKSSKTPTRMILLTPITLPRISDIILYWNQSTLFEVESSWLSGVVLSNDEIATFRFITYRILHSIHQGRMKADRYDFPWLIAPCDTSRQLSNPDYGPCPATELIAQGCDISDWGLVTRTSDGKKFMLTGIQPGCYLEMVQVPKRRDFLHPVANSFGNDAHTRIEVSAASECVVDALPSKYCVFALLFPSILYRFEIGMVAETLRTTILSPLNLEPVHLPLLVRALTSSATGEDNNYQRLELLGDCILKVFATLHLMATHLSWPESYLTEKKGRIVSNGFLARAALAVGLDRFIVTKRFTGAKWSPQYTGNLLAETQPAPKVQKSSKLVADVIESLIGASYATGGLDRAFVCIQTLLPLEPWSTIASANNVMYDAAPAGGGLVTFSILETLLGYTFKKKMLLLEALTHASFRNSQENSSYERLEFLGDAVLDYIVSTRLYAHEPALSHQKMHAIRTATVNASFLAFRMFETTVPEETINKATMQPEVQRRALWQFVRSGSPALNANRDIALRQHEDARDQIITGLSVDSRFPWHLLALNDAPKFLSDIVESVIGATYIDSHGDITACEVVVRRLGILDCLERLLRDSVDCLHPKERLGHLAAERDVQYMRVADEDTTEKRGVNLYRCQVKVGGENVGGVVEGLKRLNAETVAAWIAVGILEGCHDAAMEVSSDEDEFFDANDHGGEMMEVG
jgi:dsRNA-specific ribonuclease